MNKINKWNKYKEGTGTKEKSQPEMEGGTVCVKGVAVI